MKEIWSFLVILVIFDAARIVCGAGVHLSIRSATAACGWFAAEHHVGMI